ncbi:hypothetical protein H4R34_003425 [Dimargaris verticillata]|uniref:Ubiquitin-like domain-containing protein n=1 Tax=Dimargaris verticillata TaxID=2761393 RepID=A0A9W8B691_9FUNG|nr:hypothetical protein H4R34_003425 [Dimargaris verticillata]
MAISVVWKQNKYQFYLTERDLAAKTLGEFKRLCSEVTRVPVNGLRLIYCGAILKDSDAPMAAYGITPSSKLLLLGTAQQGKVFNVPVEYGDDQSTHTPPTETTRPGPRHPTPPSDQSDSDQITPMAMPVPRHDYDDEPYYGPMPVPVDVMPHGSEPAPVSMPVPEIPMKSETHHYGASPQRYPGPAFASPLHPNHVPTNPFRMPPMFSEPVSNASAYSSSNPFSQPSPDQRPQVPAQQPPLPQLPPQHLQSRPAHQQPPPQPPRPAPAESTCPELSAPAVTAVINASSNQPRPSLATLTPESIAHLVASDNPEEQPLLNKLRDHYDTAVKDFAKPVETFDREADDFMTQFVLNFHASSAQPDQRLLDLRTKEYKRLSDAYRKIDALITKQLIQLDNLDMPSGYANARALRKVVIKYLDGLASHCERVTKRLKEVMEPSAS